jgi:dihydroorotate dehydrogenase
MDAERVHHLSVALVRLVGTCAPWLLRCVSASWGLPRTLEKNIGSLTFSHPVGLAAGFDKNALLLPFLPALGFSFAEIGTVTPRPQGGNPRPRLFRDPRTRALFNRMGFNNDGADRVAERLAAARPRLPKGFVVGVNLGKNKDTPVEGAAGDYRLLAARFRELADYLVINVSSPNTPGLRALQSEQHLEPIVRAVLEETRGKLPVFLKLAPEIEGPVLQSLLQAAEAWGLSGFVLTNTLGGQYRGEPGGWSGEPVRERAQRALETARSATRLPIIAVGGLMSPKDAEERMQAGATLLQVYSGWIYAGPTLPARIVKHLAR